MLPIFNAAKISENAILNQAGMMGLKIFLMLPVAGISYEFIRLSANKMDNPFFRVLIFPGLILQKLTTREPTDDQLEIALASLKRVLELEKKTAVVSDQELEFSSLADMGRVSATVSEFPG